MCLCVCVSVCLRPKIVQECVRGPCVHPSEAEAQYCPRVSPCVHPSEAQYCPRHITYEKKARNHTNPTNNKQPTMTYEKKARNYTNPTNSPQTHTHTNIFHIVLITELLAVRKSAPIFASSHTNTLPLSSDTSTHRASYQNHLLRIVTW